MNNKNSQIFQIILLGVICFLLTIAICVQIKTVNQNGTTISSNQTESELKSQVLKMKEKYENQYTELQEIEVEIEKARTKATQNNEELTNLEDKIKEDNILLGNTNVYGEGVVITLDDGETNMNSDLWDYYDISPLIHGENVRDIVYMLKNAGAEAIEINGQRVVETTAMTCDGTVLAVNGVKINTPVVISAIGQPELIVSSLNMSGGKFMTFKQQMKDVTFIKTNKISISKYTGIFNFKYAKTVK